MVEQGEAVIKSGFTASILVLAFCLGNPALAQEAPKADTVGLEDIIVTATKRSENLQDVPVAISALSATALKNAGVFETSDLNHSMPNLQVSSPFGEAQPNFSLRGVGVGTEFNANAASPVGVIAIENLFGNGYRARAQPRTFGLRLRLASDST